MGERAQRARHVPGTVVSSVCAAPYRGPGTLTGHTHTLVSSGTVGRGGGVRRAADPFAPGTALEVRPWLIGPANCEAALGVSWRWLRDHAAELGLEVLRIGTKSFVDAEQAAAAIRRHGGGHAGGPGPVEPAEPEPERPVTVDELAAQLGLKRRVG